MIRSNTDLLNELHPEQRRKFEELFRVLRAERARADNVLPMQYVASVSQSEPSFEPAVFTPLPAPRKEIA